MTEAVNTLGLTATELRSRGAEWTVREIAQQPQLWPEILQRTADDAALAAFLAPQLGNASLRILLTGAGTSSFVGECLAPCLMRAGAPAVAIPTTDIVSSAASTLPRRDPTLMVHFARSGNSPESVAALELAEQRIPACAHLVVTCNAEGALYRRSRQMPRAHALLLPEPCNDRGFAMTSSFTGMLLAAAVALRVQGADASRIERMATLATWLITDCLPRLTALVGAQFERVVYLGSRELKGLAREAALKMLELTDGRVISMGETPLGFRHGPKTVLNGSAVTVQFLSNEPHARRYDLDLLAELRLDAVAGRVIALSGISDAPQHPDTLPLGELTTSYDPIDTPATDLELSLPYIVFAQTLAVLRSLSLGLTPDRPNAAGTVSRVVQGVSIYPAPPTS